MHHYNFPPFSTGETGGAARPSAARSATARSPSGRCCPVLPEREEFPYTIRLVSEVLGSNGSTSMGSVCASTLSLMDAGVPIKAPVAGIAMGLVYAEGKYTTLTDILGAEDAFGDMDFKVAGTARLRHRAAAGHQDRRHPRRGAGRRAATRHATPGWRSSRSWTTAIAEPARRGQPHAPKIITIKIPVDKIGEVIGPKGKVINTIQQETGADIAVDDDGSVGTRHHRCQGGGRASTRPGAASS